MPEMKAGGRTVAVGDHRTSAGQHGLFFIGRVHAALHAAEALADLLQGPVIENERPVAGNGCSFGRPVVFSRAEPASHDDRVVAGGQSLQCRSNVGFPVAGCGRLLHRQRLSEQAPGDGRRVGVSQVAVKQFIAYGQDCDFHRCRFRSARSRIVSRSQPRLNSHKVRRKAMAA